MILARVLDVSDGPVTPLDRLLETGAPFARTVLAPGGRAIPPRGMLWPSGFEAAEGPHRPPAHASADVEVYAVRDVVVGGAGAHVMAGDGYVWAQGAYPGYVRYWIESDITPEPWRVPALAFARRLEQAFVITHFNYVWGHWLTELYPKLFVIRALAARGLRAPIVLPSTAPGYIRSVVAHTLPDQEVLTYNPARETVSVGRLMLPDMLQRNYIFSDMLARSIDVEVQRTLDEPVPVNDLIFVSRRALPVPSAFRSLLNAEALETEAGARGFAVVHPETLSWPQQIATFAQASVVVGEFGSGLHNALMSPPGTRVVAFNWIVDVQSRIANFRGQNVGYILPDDGRPRGFTLEDQGHQPYSIDLDTFRRRLDQVLDRYAPPPLRRYDSLPL